MPNPKTSGNGRYTYLAAWGSVIKKGGTEAQARDLVTRVFKNVPVLDGGGRGATTTFTQRDIGDVLVTFENEVNLVRAEFGNNFEVVYPSSSILAESPVAVVDVASFGDAFARTENSLEVVYADPARGVYQKIVTSPDAKTLLGGIFVGDASPFTSLRPLLGRELPAEPGAFLSAAGGGEAPAVELPDDAILCSCNNVSVGSIRDAVNGCGSCDGAAPVQELSGLKSCTKAGTQCGSCVPLLKKLMEGELAKSGIEVSKALCEHFAMSRRELFEAVRSLELSSFPDILARFGVDETAKAGRGCDICKPTVANILASQNSAYVLDEGRGTLQDTNDRALANMQKDGTYSVVPRIPGGEITPDKLAVIAKVAQDYGLYDDGPGQATQPATGGGVWLDEDTRKQMALMGQGLGRRKRKDRDGEPEGEGPPAAMSSTSAAELELVCSLAVAIFLLCFVQRLPTTH